MYVFHILLQPDALYTHASVAEVQATHNVLDIVREQCLTLVTIVYDDVYCFDIVALHWQLCRWIEYIVCALAW